MVGASGFLGLPGAFYGNVDDGWLLMDNEWDGFESRNKVEEPFAGCG